MYYHMCDIFEDYQYLDSVCLNSPQWFLLLNNNLMKHNLFNIEHLIPEDQAFVLEYLQDNVSPEIFLSDSGQITLEKTFPLNLLPLLAQEFSNITHIEIQLKC